jgi:hypothetical protein
MEMSPKDELERAHRQATFIGMAMISSLIIYVIIVEFMKIDTKGMAAPVIVEIRFVNIFAKMLNNALPCARLPANRGGVLYPVRKPAGCSGDDGNCLMGANTGFIMPRVSLPVRGPKIF